MKNNRIKMLIIIDGVAEDLRNNIPTSLEMADIPTLNKLAQNSLCGEFIPQDPYTGEVKTDLIISNLLGIRPHPWPGRAYFELIYQGIPSDKIGACTFIKNPFSTSATSKAEVSEHALFISVLSEKAKLLGYNFMSRPYSRLHRSFIVWIENPLYNKKIKNNRFSVLLEHILEELKHYGVNEVTLSETWHGDSISFTLFPYRPAFVTMTEGSLPGVCGKSGIELIDIKHNVFDFYISENMIVKLKNAIDGGHFKAGILYFKDTDWASHYGDRKLKIKAIEYFDYLLSTIIEQNIEKWNESLLIISDHRSNLDSVKPSGSTSIFSLVYNHPNGSSGFNERSIQKVWNKPPLQMNELHNLFFKG